MIRAPPVTGLSRTMGLTLVALALGLLLAALVRHVRTAGERFLDKDELEHLNAACFVAQGETLYGTFFENHPPLTVAVLQAVVRSSDEPATILRRARLLSLAAMLGSLLVVARLGWGLAGGAGAALAPFLLATHTFFAHKSIEVRPDVYSTVCLVLALAVLAGGLAPGGAPRLVLAGALFAVGGLFTPKIVYASAGAVLGAVLATGPSGARSALAARARTLLWSALGAGLVAAAAAAEMARRGMLAGFLQDCIVVSARMTIDDPGRTRRVLLARTFLENPGFVLLGLMGLVLFLRERTAALAAPGRVLGCSAVAGMLGLAHTRAPLMQYHLTFLPQLALCAAFAFVAGLRAARRPGGAAAWCALPVGLVACALPPWIHWRQGETSMDTQLAVIAKVRELTNAESRVLDGWSGLYLTRRPAYRYFFLNSDMVRLLDPARLERDLHACIDDPAVEIVITGGFKVAPVSVRERIEREFERVKRFPNLRWRPATGRPSGQ